MLGTLLLTDNDFYVDENSNIPSRKGVEFDKELLKLVCTEQFVSDKAFNMLPPSIRNVVHLAEVDFNEPTVAITIKEIAKCDILIVTRSRETIVRGRQFRFDNFSLVVKQRDIEIWRRI